MISVMLCLGAEFIARGDWRSVQSIIRVAPTYARKPLFLWFIMVCCVWKASLQSEKYNDRITVTSSFVKYDCLDYKAHYGVLLGLL